MTENKQKTQQPEKLSLLQIMTSALAAMFGVQSKRTLERDLRSGEILKFILVGVILTALFVILLISLTSFIGRIQVITAI